MPIITLQVIPTDGISSNVCLTFASMRVGEVNPVTDGKEVEIYPLLCKVLAEV